MKKQTAIEWFVEQLEQHHIKIDIKNTVVFQQAKAMQKEQIKKAYSKGVSKCLFIDIDEDINGEQYYNKTYKK